MLRGDRAELHECEQGLEVQLLREGASTWQG